MMRSQRLFVLVVAVLVLPALGAADDFTLTGVGGGGWLDAGAIHPSDSTLIVIGADVSGVSRSDDFGGSWAPWNEGIPDSNETASNYVADLLGIDYEGWSGFYATTFGGIYRATLTGDWACMTPVPAYSYEDIYGSHAQPIPFACLDWNGEGLIVAGAGLVRWGTNAENNAYPGLGPSRFKQSGAYDGEWTIWTLDLNDTLLAWAPDESTTFGAARDVSVTVLGGDTYIAVATPEGIYVKDDVGWQSVCDDLYDEGLTCWSIHLTERGTLYAAMEKESGTYPSGVYRLFDVDTSSDWTWVGDDTLLPPKDWSLETIGQNDQLIFLSVVDGDSTDPDLLYLGGYANGLFRTYQPYDPDEKCTWQHKVYRQCSYGTCVHYYLDKDGNPKTLDIGWQTEYGLCLGFHPIVSQVYKNRIAVHFTGRMHVSTECGDSWEQSYVDSVGGCYETRGYNELCVVDLDFMSGRRAVESTGDHGVFRSSDASLETWERLQPAISGGASPASDTAWTYETARVGVLNDTLYVVSGDLCQLAAPCKLFMVDDEGAWHHVTDSLNSDRYHFWDFIFTPDEACFMSYTKYDRRAGTLGAKVDEIGVFKGTRDANGWSWVTWNNGLCAVDTPESVNARGAEFLYHPMSGRLYMAARHAKTTLASYSTVDLPGGLYMLPSPDSTTWHLEFGGDGTIYKDFRCLAKSDDDSVMYAGTRGRSWAGIGTVLKCEDPWATPTTWTPLANTAETGYPFGFGVPFWSTWSWTSVNIHFTDVRGLAVNPWDRDIVYVGMYCEGFMPQEGLWVYDEATGWDHLSEGEPFIGIGVPYVAIKKRLMQAKLAIGTSGQEVYYMTIEKPIGPLSGKTTPQVGPGLKILWVRPLVAGRAAEINFSLNRASPIDMEIFDVTGRMVTGRDTGRHDAGMCRLVWDCRSDHGRRCAPGVYFLRLKAGQETVTKKFVVVR